MSCINSDKKKVTGDFHDVYYAKSVLSNGNHPTVKEHLDAVSKLSEQFAEEFGKAEIGRAAGLLHDFGKYSKKFQLVLSHRAEGVDHAIGGAFYILKQSKSDTFLFRRRGLIEAINGHHDGLVSYDSIKRWFDEFSAGEKSIQTNGQKQCVFDIDTYKTAEVEFCRDFSDYMLPKMKKDGSNELLSMLDCRMLFSCLVDADHSVSAYENDVDYFDNNTPAPFMPEIWLEKLDEYRNDLRLKSNSNQKLNQIRDYLYEQCGDMGDSEHKGLFTLTAPTGTGKTLALLHFALRHSIRHNRRRIIIVLPFLTLLEQNAKEYRNIISELVEDHSQKDLSEDAMEYASNWNEPVILTTSVKFFESLFAQKSTNCRKLHNIANSVIVFDEAQSLPTDLIPSTLQAVNGLCEKYNCSVVFSTATQPKFDTIKNLSWSPIEIMPDNEKLYQALKRVNVQWKINNETDLESIAEEMANKESVCTIVNLRKHARSLFNILKAKCDNDESLFFLCSDVCPAHRTQIVKKIKELTATGLPCRVVATQCIEAGVDLDFKYLYRALAPLESIIQAAGRCNRNGNWDSEQSIVTVFRPAFEGVKYPDNRYEEAANKVHRLNSEKMLDINSPKDIDRYYEAVFSDKINDDKLTAAIENRDYLKVSEEYQLIKQNGYQLIVPYSEELQLFQAVRDDVLTNGISKKLMRKASGITISIYEKKEILDKYAECLYYPKKKGYDIYSQYYLLRPQYYDLYDEKMGFQADFYEKNDIALF